jgi:hypothetical protein
MGLCRNRPLVAEALSRSIAARQRAAYRRSPALRDRLAVGQELSRTGELALMASAAPPASPPPELTRLRRAALDAGRATRSAQRDRALAHRLRELGFAAACAAHAGLGPASLVLYDVSTLYFKAGQGDGFREPGFRRSGGWSRRS